MQINKDANLDKKFKELHEKIVNDVILFCKENNITVDSFYLIADGVKESIPNGKWCPCTDSCFTLGDKKPFLMSI